MLVNVTAEIALGRHVNPPVKGHFLSRRTVMVDGQFHLKRLVLKTA
jgi:hypothetical protein